MTIDELIKKRQEEMNSILPDKRKEGWEYWEGEVALECLKEAKKAHDSEINALNIEIAARKLDPSKCSNEVLDLINIYNEHLSKIYGELSEIKQTLGVTSNIVTRANISNINEIKYVYIIKSLHGDKNYADDYILCVHTSLSEAIHRLDYNFTTKYDFVHGFWYRIWRYEVGSCCDKQVMVYEKFLKYRDYKTKETYVYINRWGDPVKCECGWVGDRYEFERKYEYTSAYMNMDYYNDKKSGCPKCGKKDKITHMEWD